MPIFYMAVGLPSCGKSTHVSSLDAIHISSDAIREELFNDVNDQSHNGEVFNEMFKRSVAALKNDKNVYYDATNLSAKRRINLLNSFSFIPNLHKVCLLFTTPFGVCVERNFNRSRKVPQYVMDRMLKNFEPPHESEGWNEIKLIGHTAPQSQLLHISQDLCSISHDNPNHSLTIGEHMAAAYKIYHEKYACEYSYVIAEACKLHDIGKGMCKTFSNARGEKTDIAHYYNHENVGAYLYLSHTPHHAYVLEIVNLIAHHMDFFKGEKYLAKIRARMGENFYSKLLVVHNCDVAAH